MTDTFDPANADHLDASHAPVTRAALDGMLAAAFRFHLSGQQDDAEQLYQAIIAAPSPHATASYGLGLLYYTQGRYAEAAHAYRRTIAICGTHVDAIANLATTLLALGRYDEAIEHYRHAITLRPDFALAHANLGKAFQDTGRLVDAIAAYRRAIDLDPQSAVALANLSGALLENGEAAAAVAASDRAIALQPAMGLAHANRAVGLLRLGRHADAHAACRCAVHAGVADALLHATLGGVLLEVGAFAEAECCCRRAIGLDPDLAMAHFNLAHAAKGMNRLDDAELSCRQAIALSPDSAEYHFLLAHLLLLRGDYAAGWEEYEWRWRLPDFGWLRVLQAELTQPVWCGEDLAHKTILVLTEQGIGDILLFIRYVPLLTDRGARVVVAAPPSMRRLLSSIPNVTIVPIAQRPLPHFDVYSPLLSLPRLFGTRVTTIPAPVPYLRADPAQRTEWRDRLRTSAHRFESRRRDDSEALPPMTGRPRVGIIWAGNPATKHDRFRSPGLERIAPLFDVRGISFVALQLGPSRAGSTTAALPNHVLDLGDDLDDLATTAAIMSELDLVVSSCTGPLHLAGALGVPAWAVLPFAPYFPWLLGRDDSPWYPTMRLFRQERAGEDWSTVIGRVAGELAVFASSHVISRTTLNRLRAPAISDPVSAAD